MPAIAVGVVVGIGLACCLLVGLSLQHRSSISSSAPEPGHSPQRLALAQTPFEVELSNAKALWSRARQAVDREREVAEARDPDAAEPSRREGVHSEAWRLWQLSLDRSGCLKQANTVARRAAALARTPRDEYRAAMLRAILAHEGGDHPVELQQAQSLVRLRPEAREALYALERAARCYGLTTLERSAILRRQAVDARSGENTSLRGPAPPPGDTRRGG